MLTQAEIDSYATATAAEQEALRDRFAAYQGIVGAHLAATYQRAAAICQQVVSLSDVVAANPDGFTSAQRDAFAAMRAGAIAQAQAHAAGWPSE